ncbi:ATP-binding protein [Pseudomonas amygdali]|uniref:ATP-binding protein n=1 Tax=Pseudomonas amygdali TaxID=47877 RepID=UPI001FB7A164|nr:ATP-binding protein [Pseudomonas amygdali]UPT38913.1 ATP-binding protein [Pseudomonas amygdali pv. loropetali]
MTPELTIIHNDELRLVAGILDSNSSSKVVQTRLQTDERVIARVTDGIYRQPASAIRELISNAYDADATRVIVKTDAPRFDKITVEDNGHGMSPQILAHLLMHIGGSAKRNENGKAMGVTDSNDSNLSPNGRQLIGKIGIGLFSVAQLTYTFQIITKTKGDDHRTIATVSLKQYSDDHTEGEKPDYESGLVNIWREKATDIGAHGTSIVLTKIRHQAKDTLRSREVWSIVERNEELTEHDEKQSIEPPKYHIGQVTSQSDILRKDGDNFSSIPWGVSDSPPDAFRKLVECVWDEASSSNPNPQLERMFDYYLRMVWQISLALPIPYVAGHLFDLPQNNALELFELSNIPKGSAKQITQEKGKLVRDALDLKDVSVQDEFDVYFDDLMLSRPLKFTGLPTTSHALKKPLVFLGKCTEKFEKISKSLSGGTLSFEAYLFWSPRIAPTEHQGSLIRIHGASGTLFDPTFMRYQVSELTRLRQITCEIFITKGLDSALNIDRESFNNAHPHAVFITKWLHSALRQLATAQKKMASLVRSDNRDDIKHVAVSKIHNVVSAVWTEQTKDSASSPPSIELNSASTENIKNLDTYFYQKDRILPSSGAARGSKAKNKENILEEKLKAIAQILASFGVLDALNKPQQEKLLKAIYLVLETPDE